MAPRPQPLDERLFLGYVVDESGCWLWQGGLTDGYGKIFEHSKKNRSPHRVSYELHVGEIPAGTQIDHLCRVRHCVNPDHLEVVTPEENNRRGESPTAVNARKDRCIRDHTFDGVDSRGWRTCSTCLNLAKRERATRIRPADQGA